MENQFSQKLNGLSEMNFQGWLQHLLTTHEVIFIPFLCYKCGECCREASIQQGYFNPFEISSFLKLPVRVVIEKYLGEIIILDEERVEWKSNRPLKPCPFLEGNRCIIYPIRPGPCKSYPLFTDFGTCGVQCPSMQQMNRAAGKIGRGIPYYCSPYSDKKSPTVQIKPKRWNLSLWKYVESNPSKEALEIFIHVNKPSNYSEMYGK